MIEQETNLWGRIGVVVLCVASAMLLSWAVNSWFTPKTPEQIKAETEQRIADAKIEEERTEANHRRNLETLKAREEIERAKPVEVRVQEKKNEETSTGEAVLGTAGIVTAGYVISKMLE